MCKKRPKNEPGRGDKERERIDNAFKFCGLKLRLPLLLVRSAETFKEAFLVEKDDALCSLSRMETTRRSGVDTLNSEKQNEKTSTKMSSSLFLESTTLVRDALEGATLLGGNARVAVTPDNVVYSTDREGVDVAVVSGGGAGHEPAHGGFVGVGMLAGAVSGNVFASPSTGQVLGCLSLLARDAVVVVKNYTGDRLSFGRAIERFSADSSVNGKAKMVVVADDCAIPNDRTRTTGRRGLAGTVLVYKIAGEKARRGGSLNEVAAVAEAVAARVGTVGVALRNNVVELGLGIHGEQGFSTLDKMLQKDLAKLLVDMIVVPDPARYTLPLNPKGHLVVLINNLGSVTDLEINAFQNHVLQYIRATYPNIASLRVITGRLMTSLQMNVLSLTLLVNPNEEMLELLDAEPQVGQWPGVVHVNLEKFKAGPSTETRGAAQHNLQGPCISATQAQAFKDSVRAAANALIASEQLLTEFDTVAGDGDCGHTMKAGGAAILNILGQLPVDHPASSLMAISVALETAMGGSSGVLYCILLDAAAGHISSISTAEITPHDWAVALQKGVHAIMKYGGAKEGDRTMIDALSPLVNSLLANSQDFEAAIAAVTSGAKATESMKSAGAGRSSYIGADLTVPDPGAHAVMLWATAVLSVLK
ncbi:UNVERIFIED_CONTAM: Dihydroxyacetone kinase 2 [Siphonaria sp. JEL0065]|nr:Dihydroxyacetone kinase 2 [Siphonaria sp. JEL0065]